MMGSTAGLSPSYPGRARNPTCSSMGPLSVESPGGRGEGWRLRVQQAATRTPGSHPWIHEPQCPFQRDFDSGNPSSRTLSALIRTHQTERQGAGEVQSVLVPALVSPSPQAWAAPSKGHRDHPGGGGKGRATAKSGLLACHLTSCCVTISKSLTLTLASWSVTRRLALYVSIGELSAFGDTLRQSV